MKTLLLTTLIASALFATFAARSISSGIEGATKARVAAMEFARR